MMCGAHHSFNLLPIHEDNYKSLILPPSFVLHFAIQLTRLVADESSGDATETSHATLIYALELKPYIEEPPSVDLFPGGSGYLDLRPHFRHDFVLSTSEAVDKYWQTLEYCYAAADPKAASHAFPGSVVHEVPLEIHLTCVLIPFWLFILHHCSSTEKFYAYLSMLCLHMDLLSCEEYMLPLKSK